MHPREQTIFALSSGRPPSAISIVRVSGPHAGAALTSLAGRIPMPRMATRALLRDAKRQPIDDAVVLWFPAPDNFKRAPCFLFEMPYGIFYGFPKLSSQTTRRREATAPKLNQRRVPEVSPIPCRQSPGSCLGFAHQNRSIRPAEAKGI